MNRIAIVALGAALAALEGCQRTPLTLEEAQALCTRRGGLLAIIYEQQITASGIGQQVGHPGQCVLMSKFGAGAPLPANAPPPAK